MGKANGSRECAPDDELRDTHQLQFIDGDGFREELNPSYALPSFRGARSASYGFRACAKRRIPE
jgi:hypothetical protein